MRRLAFVSVCVLWFVVACVPVIRQPTPLTLPSVTASLTLTRTPAETVTPSYTPSHTPTLLPTKTLTPTPFPTPGDTPKPFLISNATGAGDGADEDYICLRWRYAPSFILYEDGQLIRYYVRGGLMETTISPEEIRGLLARIEQTGYLAVRDIGGPPQENPLYHIPGTLGEYGAGGPSESLAVKGNKVFIENSLAAYVVKPVWDTIAIVRGFQPSGMTPYRPLKLYLIVWPVKDSKEYWATPIPPSTEWPPTLPALSWHVGFQELGHRDTETVLDLKLFNQFPSGRIFTQSGEEHYVVACPILP